MKNVRYVLIGFIFSYLVKCLVKTPSIHDALIMITISAIFAANEYFEQQKLPNIKKELEKSIEELRVEIKSLKTDVSKNSLSAIKPTYKF